MDLSVDGHFGCFSLLALVNSAFVNVVCKYLGILISIPLDTCPEEEFLDYNYIFKFLRNIQIVFSNSCLLRLHSLGP